MTRAVQSLSDEGLAEGELWVFLAGDTSDPPSDCSVDCLRYTWDGTQYVYASGTWDVLTVDACPKSATNPGGPDAVGVYLQYRHSFLTGLFGAGITFGEVAVLNFEPAPPAEGCL
jgi:hypothetical protein